MIQFDHSDLFHFTASLENRIMFIKKLVKPWENEEDETSKFLIKQYEKEVASLNALNQRVRDALGLAHREVA